jgi:hypothetical protein
MQSKAPLNTFRRPVALKNNKKRKNERKKQSTPWLLLRNTMRILWYQLTFACVNVSPTFVDPFTSAYSLTLQRSAPNVRVELYKFKTPILRTKTSRSKLWSWN